MRYPKPIAGVRKKFGMKPTGRLPTLPFTAGKSPAQIRAPLRQMAKPGRLLRGQLKVAEKVAGVHSFPGKIDKSKRYAKGTVGRFVQSTRGMEGKKYLEKALQATISQWVNEG